MKPLALGDYYDREAVHDLFDPFSKFTRQAGTWGLQGIIQLKLSGTATQVKDYVFFVTYGQSQGQHHFEEGITLNGILSWQSQPKQRINDNQIIDFIKHDPVKNNIFLFLRTSKGMTYQYLGRLGYEWHDQTSNQPVYFRWQLLDWDEDLRSKIKFALSSNGQVNGILNETNSTNPRISNEPSIVREPDFGSMYLVETKRPDIEPADQPQIVRDTNLQLNNKPRNINFAEQNERNTTLGKWGERIVLRIEKERLIKAGRKDLADKAYLTSDRIGNNAVYDIHSFDLTAEPRLIEVKTTQQGVHTPFFMSAQEYEFAMSNSANYVLYRVYELDSKHSSASYFVIDGRDIESIYKEASTYLIHI